MTLVLSAGGAVGAWPIGAPASPWRTADSLASADGGDGTRTPERLRTASAHLLRRDMEGANGDLARPAEEGSNAQQSRPEGAPVDSGDGSDSDAARPAPTSGTGGDEQAADASAPLPEHSGSGRRVVFDMSEQQVWLVGPAGRVQRTYPVSGSRTDNLSAGRYEVYSRSRDAVSYTYEETMGYMVRFAHGENAAIGFHDLPVDQQGERVQTRAQLGTPLSSGCIRQARPDARAMWRFAHVGTAVVVVD